MFASEVHTAVHTAVHMVTLEYPPFDWGGISTAVRLMRRGFREGRHPVILGTLGERDEIEAMGDGSCTIRVGIDKPADGRHPIYSDRFRQSAGEHISTRLFEAMAERICENDLVICHSEELLEFCRLAKVNKHIQLYYFCHGLQALEHPEAPDLDLLQREMIALADVTLGASEAQAAAIKSRFPRGQVQRATLPLSYLVSAQSAAVSKESGRPAKVVRLLAAGRGVPQKGFDILLTALAEIHAELPPYSVEMFIGHGDDHYIGLCARLARRLNQRVLYPWLPHNELFAKLADADVVIVPSRFEPFGLVAAEAMCWRKAVVASAVGGLKELLEFGACGLLVPAEDGIGPDASALAKAILETARDDDRRRRLGDAGRRKILKEHTPSSFLAPFEKVLSGQSQR